MQSSLDILQNSKKGFKFNVYLFACIKRWVGCALSCSKNGHLQICRSSFPKLLIFICDVFFKVVLKSDEKSYSVLFTGGNAMS